MFSFMRYCCVQLINGIGDRLNLNNLSFLFTMHESPPIVLKEQSHADVVSKQIIDLEISTLISEDESQINEINFNLESVEEDTPKKNTEDWSLLASNETPNEIIYSPICISDGSCVLSDSREDSVQSINFNDTIEEVEFMIEKGLQILNKTVCDPIAPKSNKNAAINTNYDYVKSPIRTYIKYSPLTPLRRNNNSHHQRIRLETLSESSIFCNCDNDNKQVESTKKEKSHSLPRRAYINSAHKQIIYENGAPIRRDGLKMQKLLGETKKSPTVIKHYGRLRSKTLSQRKENIPVDDSFHDFSMMDYGDTSVHVVKNAKRNYVL